MKSPRKVCTLERDVADHRDHEYAFALTSDHHARKLPPKVDLLAHCPSVLDQGASGTCTAHAVASAFAYLHKVHKSRRMKPSPRFVFYNERAMTRQLGAHCVVHLRDALKAAAVKGVCPDSVWPYRDDDRLLRRKPPKQAFQAAHKKRVATYHRILIESHPRRLFLSHLKHCLADGYPFVFGFQTYESFRKRSGKWKDGIMPIPNRRTEAKTEGHAVMAVGYDDARKAFLIRNSWSADWGMDGNFYMPYELITDPKIAFDFWTLRGVAG
jgi:C1A family cysteine protease